MIHFNALIPELIVFHLEDSLSFYCEYLSFQVLYQRPEEKFVMIEKQGIQIMLIQRNGEWETGEFLYPLGRGINFEMAVSDYDDILQRLSKQNYPFFQASHINTYQVQKIAMRQEEFLIQDPNGYLLRFVRK